VIDLQQNQQTKSFVDRQLRRFGIGSINDAIAALAGTIRDHKHLETFLTSIDSLTDRQEVYDSIRSHLRFEAWPLDRYVAAANSMAEREQLPVLGEDGHLHPFKPAQDVKTVEKMIASIVADRQLTLMCSKCTTQDTFYQIGLETSVDMRIKALKDGWILVPKELCPKCRPLN
jgi:hypothetical protein